MNILCCLPNDRIQKYYVVSILQKHCFAIKFIYLFIILIIFKLLFILSVQNWHLTYWLRSKLHFTGTQPLIKYKIDSTKRAYNTHITTHIGNIIIKKSLI